jgi:hypothetical protein
VELRRCTWRVFRDRWSASAAARSEIRVVATLFPRGSSSRPRALPSTPAACEAVLKWARIEHSALVVPPPPRAARKRDRSGRSVDGDNDSEDADYTIRHAGFETGHTDNNIGHNLNHGSDDDDDAQLTDEDNAAPAAQRSGDRSATATGGGAVRRRQQQRQQQQRRALLVPTGPPAVPVSRGSAVVRAERAATLRALVSDVSPRRSAVVAVVVTNTCGYDPQPVRRCRRAGCGRLEAPGLAAPHSGLCLGRCAAPLWHWEYPAARFVVTDSDQTDAVVEVPGELVGELFLGGIDAALASCGSEWASAARALARALPTMKVRVPLALRQTCAVNEHGLVPIDGRTIRVEGIARTV